MKKVVLIAMAVAMILVFAGCNSAQKNKSEIISLVTENYDAIVTACENADAAALMEIEGIRDVRVTDGFVICLCIVEGISVSSQDYGFYYSRDNQIVGIDYCLDIGCLTWEMTPDGDGYSGVTHSAVYYTEHIQGNLYYYKNET